MASSAPGVPRTHMATTSLFVGAAVVLPRRLLLCLMLAHSPHIMFVMLHCVAPNVGRTAERTARASESTNTAYNMLLWQWAGPGAAPQPNRPCYLCTAKYNFFFLQLLFSFRWCCNGTCTRIKRELNQKWLRACDDGRGRSERTKNHRTRHKR